MNSLSEYYRTRRRLLGYCLQFRQRRLSQSTSIITILLLSLASGACNLPSLLKAEKASNYTEVHNIEKPYSIQGNFDGRIQHPRSTHTVKLNGLYRFEVYSPSFEPILSVQQNGNILSQTIGRPEGPTITGTGEDYGEILQLALWQSCDRELDPCPETTMYFRAESANDSYQVSITSAESNPEGGFRLKLEKINFPSLPNFDLTAGSRSTGYLAYQNEAGNILQHEYVVTGFPGQRLGIHAISEDFVLELRIETNEGELVASSSLFNLETDPCGDAKIEEFGLAFEDLSRSHAYLVLGFANEASYKVIVRAREPGQSGLYNIEAIDRSSQFITPNQMRYGSIFPQADWATDRFISYSRTVTVRSAVPLRVRVEEMNGEVILETTTRLPKRDEEEEENDLAPWGPTPRLYPYEAPTYNTNDSSIGEEEEVESEEQASLEDRLVVIVVSSDQDVGFQQFALDDSSWGQCGGGAGSIPLSVFPEKDGFNHAGVRFPLSHNNYSLGVHTLNLVIRSKLSWLILFQHFEEPEEDQAVDVLSTYATYLPSKRAFREVLVDFRIALRLQIRREHELLHFIVWTRVENKGRKGIEWKFSPEETAYSQMLLEESMRKHLTRNIQGR